MVQRHPLLPSFGRRTLPTPKKCFCELHRYLVPRFNLIPEILQNFTFEHILVLRPFDVDPGYYERAHHGYRVKTGAFSLSPSTLSVEQKVNGIQDRNHRNVIRQIYTFLLTLDSSTYRDMVDLRQTMLNEKKEKMFLMSLHTLSGLECCFWPNLYPFSSWCDSTIEGAESRQSSKVSFNVKRFSEITDYSLSYEMLLYQYDRLIFKTGTGAISSAREFECFPATSLDGKTFSQGYWKWQHRFLLDLLDIEKVPQP